MAIKKAIYKVQKCTTFWQVNDAFNIYNRLSIIFVHDLSINLLVLVYQKGKGSLSEKYKRLYNLLNIEGKLIIIQLLHNSVKFRSISIKRYFIDNQEPILDSLVFT